MARSAAKLSVSVPGELAAQVRKAVGARGLSAFVARAMQHELERAQLATFLRELEDELGLPSNEAVRQARAAWTRRR